MFDFFYIKFTHLEKETIIVKGAREHNLKDIDIEIPRDSFTVITGFQVQENLLWLLILFMQKDKGDILNHLSAYARQFLDMLEKPDVDLIEGT
jgi:excinuclease ABC subunit A